MKAQAAESLPTHGRPDCQVVQALSVFAVNQQMEHLCLSLCLSVPFKLIKTLGKSNEDNQVNVEVTYLLKSNKIFFFINLDIEKLGRGLSGSPIAQLSECLQ